MQCISKNIIIIKEDNRFSTKFEVMQKQMEKQKAKHFSVLCLLSISKFHCAFPASCKYRQPAFGCYLLVGQILEIWPVLAVSQFQLCGTKVSGTIFFPQITYSSSWNYWQVQLDTIQAANRFEPGSSLERISQIGKFISSWRDTIHVAWNTSFTKEDADPVCIDECLWQSFGGENFSLPTTVSCFIWRGRL